MAWKRWTATYADGKSATFGATTEAKARQKAIYYKLSVKIVSWVADPSTDEG